MISLVIADDHPLFRQGIRRAVEEDASIRIVGEAGEGATALRLIRDLSPDVAVLDIDMPLMKGLQVAKTVQAEHLAAAVIILTIYNGGDLLDEALDAGVRGYVTKETAVLHVLEAIKTVAEGEHYVSPGMAGHLVGRRQRLRALVAARPGLSLLTPSERRILRLIGANMTSKEIADDLCISYRTVETHRTNIAAKLNIRGSHALLKFAIENRHAM